MTQANPEQVRQITQDVLGRPEFLERPTWSQILLDRVFDWLRSLSEWASKNPDLSRLLIIALSIALLLLLGHIIYTVAREFVSVRQPQRGARGRAPLRALEGVADNWNDAFGYGAVFAVSYRVSPAFTLGAGAGVFRRTEETKGFPYIAVDWKITEDLRLSNPFRTSPSGPAGLELSWRISDRWEIAAGGAYRSFRFRLDDSGVAPNGVGEQESAVGYARLTYRMGRDLKLDLYGGAAFNGKMRINDRDGNELGSDDFETAPMAAFSLTMNF